MPGPTSGDVITQALLKINAYAPGDVISAADMNQGLTTLADMMDSWSNENLACYAMIEQSVLLVPGQQTYTIGPGGDIDGQRPLRINAGPGAAYVQDENGNNYPIDVVVQSTWNQIGNRSELVNSNFPDTLFYNPQFPLGLLNFYPIPNIGYTAFWDSFLQLTDFSNLTTEISFPPGYKKAFQDNLACELWPFFFPGEVPAPLLRQAALSRGNIKRTNIILKAAQYDAGIGGRQSGRYNIYQDSYNR